MPSKTVRKRQLARKIAQAMGTSNKRPLVEASHPMIQARFHPHSHQGPKKGYPLYHIEHELSKLPRENVASFVNIPAVIGQLQRLPPITRLLKRYPSLARGFEKTVWEAIRERGIKGSKFWATAPKAYIDTIAKAGKGNPNLMNDRVGRITKRFFGNQIKPRTILDIGTFAGGTIVGAVKGLSPEQRKQLKVVLVDINERVVREHAVPQLVGLGIPKRNILVLPASFYSAAVAFKQMRRPFHEKGQQRYTKQFLDLIGKVDMITAGASTINFANDLSPLLRSVRRLLKPKGVFVDWEWGSAEATSPTVKVPELKRTVIARAEGRPVTIFDAYVSFLNFWMGPRYFDYPEHVKQKLWRDIENSKEFNFFTWCRKNRDWMEREREDQPRLLNVAGYRNRAYREGKAMAEGARQYGFNTDGAEYPFAKPGEKDTGNVNWMVVAQKE